MHRKLLPFIIITAFLMTLVAGCKNNPVSSNQSSAPNPYGFVGNGKVDNTNRIQTVIDSTSDVGGGTIVFPKGDYLTGPIILKSNVTIELKKGAVIDGTTDKKKYYPAGSDTMGPLPNTLRPLIHSDNAKNIRISGQGIINGNGREWWQMYNDAKNSGSNNLPARPRLMELDNTNNIVIDSVQIKNSPMFHIFLKHDNHVKIQNVTIKAPSNSPNTDGIDPATSHDVTITNCTIDDGDDNIAIKSGSPDPNDPHAGTSRIYIKNNTFLHGHGVSIGSETNGGVDSVFVENNTFKGTTNGFRIKTSRNNGGNVRGVEYKNNKMTDVENPILFTCYYPNIPVSDSKQPIRSTTPNIHDVTIDHLTSSVTSSFGGTPTGGQIIGLPERHITNITLKNVSIDVKGITGSRGMQVRNATLDTSNVTITTQPIQVNAPAEDLTGLSAGYEVPSSGTSREIQKVQPDASTSGSSGTHSWPDESNYNSNRYIQFSMGPKSDYGLTVDSLALIMGSKGTSGMHAAVYYAVGSSYTNPTKLTKVNSLSENSAKDTTLTGQNTSYLNITVTSGQKLFVRIYPWLPGGTTSTTKYMYIGYVRVYGKTQYPKASGDMVWPLTSSSNQKPHPLNGAFIMQKGAVVQGV